MSQLTQPKVRTKPINQWQGNQAKVSMDNKPKVVTSSKSPLFHNQWLRLERFQRTKVKFILLI